MTGEAGIGKTAVVEAFAAEVAADPTVWLAHGQCVEQYGTGEAYLPILEALGRLCRTPRGEQLIPLLRQRAPIWLVQMPWLLRAEDRELLAEIYGWFVEGFDTADLQAASRVIASIPSCNKAA